jgi:hypothetical protein
VFSPSFPPSRKIETMTGSVTPPGVAACAAAASQMRFHESIEAP